MAVIPTEYSKRYYYYSNDWSSGARWAFFALFLVAIAIAIFGTLRVNRARSRRGVQPLYGTSWMTPPAYRPNTDGTNPNQENYVPTYTATANDADMGYYDQQGNFHQNPNVKNPDPPQPAHIRTGSGNYPNNYGMPMSNLNEYDNNNGINGTNTTGNTDHAAGNANYPTYSSPAGPPPGMSNTGTSGPSGYVVQQSDVEGTNTGTSSQPIYSRPDVPPPSQGKS